MNEGGFGSRWWGRGKGGLGEAVENNGDVSGRTDGIWAGRSGGQGVGGIPGKISYMEPMDRQAMGYSGKLGAEDSGRSSA